MQKDNVNSKIFERILFSRIALKDIFALLKILGHDLAISTNDRVISSFSEDFIFLNLRISENKTLAKISEFTEIGSLK